MERDYDQREDLHEAQAVRGRHDFPRGPGGPRFPRDVRPAAIYNGIERRRPGRVTHDSSPSADREAKMRAWQNTLEKAAGVLRTHGHRGDAATLEDIARVLREVKP